MATWMFMMLTALRKRFSLTQTVFLSIVKKYRIIHFLSEQYELLHYYDNDYIINDIVKHIEDQGGNKDELRRTA